MITNTVEYLSKSDRTGLKFDEFDEFIETSNAIHIEESYCLEKTIISSYELLKLQHEAEILHEQVESLKQELEYKSQLVEIYQQELLDANSEMEAFNSELQNLYKLERLNLDGAKRLARDILSSHRLTSQSLAELLSAIYHVEATADQLEPIKIKCKKAFDKQVC